MLFFIKNTVAITADLCYNTHIKGRRGMHMEQFRLIPIGHQDFKTIIENGCYYVDKLDSLY